VEIAQGDVAKEVQSGRARLGVMGAERFFLRGSGRRGQQQGIEAVGVLGSRMLHVLRRDDDDGDALAGRLGVPPSDSGAGRALANWLEAIGKAKPNRQAPAEQLLDALRSGELDGVLLLSEVGAGWLTQAIDTRKLRLRALPNVRQQVPLPFMRQARIPAGSYTGQDEALDTLGIQLLIVGPARDVQDPLSAGPAAAMAGTGVPLTIAEADALAEATGAREGPDPLLPSAWTSFKGAKEANEESALITAIDTGLNLAVLAFLAWVIRLLLAPLETTGVSKGRRARSEDAEAPAPGE
jgi:hypothetical protein